MKPPNRRGAYIVKSAEARPMRVVAKRGPGPASVPTEADKRLVAALLKRKAEDSNPNRESDLTG